MEGNGREMGGNGGEWEGNGGKCGGGNGGEGMEGNGRGGMGLVLELVLVLLSRHLQKTAICPPRWCSHSQCVLTYVLTHRLWASSRPTPGLRPLIPRAARGMSRPSSRGGPGACACRRVPR